MICTYCSAEMPAISVFCPGCGRAVNSGADVSPGDVPPREDTVKIADCLLAAISYIALLPAILFLALPSLRSSRYVRFHCWQSVLFAVSTVVLAALTRGVFALLSVIPGVGLLFAILLAGVVALALAMLWCVLVLKAVQGQTYELPWLGRWAGALAG